MNNDTNVDLDDFSNDNPPPVRDSKGYFLPGNKLAQMNKGIPRIQDNPPIKKIVSEADLKAFKKFIRGYGLGRLMEEMQCMDGMDFVRTMVLVLPYTLPKIVSTEEVNEDDKKRYQIAHSVTIKDMTTGTEKTIKVD